MNTSKNIAKHLREIHFGGNWTCVNMKDTLSGLTWQEVTTQVYGFNTIATLTHHVNYYVDAVIKVFEGEALNAKDELSFNHPPIASQQDWEKMLDKVFTEAEKFAVLIEELPDEKLWEDFTDKKYGIYYRNLHGIIEHMHYHLGQIVILKKIILQQEAK
ncbi:DUF1572 domain-containing protein [Sphingobacteriaceae bacterium]|nr:DUF1572 domain-containing protein [Sphingobacteriaceae bacterium]